MKHPYKKKMSYLEFLLTVDTIVAKLISVQHSIFFEGGTRTSCTFTLCGAHCAVEGEVRNTNRGSCTKWHLRCVSTSVVRSEAHHLLHTLQTTAAVTVQNTVQTGNS